MKAAPINSAADECDSDVREVDSMLETMESLMAEVNILQSALHATTAVLNGVLGVCGHHDLLRNVVTGHLNEGYERYSSPQFTQYELDAYEAMSNRYLRCMRDSKQAMDAMLRREGD